jgi:hypothetical protein
MPTAEKHKLVHETPNYVISPCIGICVVQRKTNTPSSQSLSDFVVCFLLGDSPASEFYKPTFRNTLSVPSS